MNVFPQDAWDRRLAAPMFAATVLLLTLVGAAAEWLRMTGGRLPSLLVWSAAGVYAIFLIELLFHVVRRDRYCRRRVLACLFPPLRLCARDYRSPNRLWVPFRGWVERNPRLTFELERAFSLPMIGVALLILPLLAVELALERGWVPDHPYLRPLLSVATCLVWLAFTVEFFVMIAVVENKLDYCKRHWMDIVIICLPFVAFLRFVRLGQALRLQQISRLSRAYRLRGVTMRAWRSVLLLDLIARVIRVSPERQLAKVRQMIQEKEAELAMLRERAEELEAELAAPAKAERELSLSEDL